MATFPDVSRSLFMEGSQAEVSKITWVANPGPGYGSWSSSFNPVSCPNILSSCGSQKYQF